MPRHGPAAGWALPRHPGHRHRVRGTAVAGKAAAGQSRAGLALGLLLLALSLSTGSAAAQSASQSAAQSDGTPNIIFDIRIEGATQVAPGQVLAHMSSRIQGPLRVDTVTSDLKEIYAMGYFSDVRAVAEEVPGLGYVLVIQLEEKPRVTSIRILGRTIVSETSLNDAMSISVGTTYSDAKMRQAMDAIRQAYRKEGYYTVNVSFRVDRHSPHDFGVTFIIEESPRVYITQIEAHQNKVLSTLELRRLMSSGEVDCFNWVNSSGVYDEELINQDLRLITSWYLDQGYIRVLIDKPKVILTHTRDYSRVNVSLTISEGAQYFTGTVDIEGDIQGDKQELLDRLQLQTGDVYSPFVQNQDVFRLNEVYQDQGFAFVQVVPQTRINDQTHIVDVTYRIARGEKAYIGRIEFQGNRETRDYVLRREFEVRENELYDGQKLRLSQENLRALGYFQPGISIEREPRDINNILDITAKVEESQTGTLQAQLGFSEQTGITTSVSVTKGNLFGRGQTLRASLQASQHGVTRSVSVDFIDPHVFHSEYSSDSSVEFQELEDLTELDRGLINQIRFSQGFGMPIIRNLRASLTYSLVNRDFQKASEDAVRLRTLTPALRYNSVNHPIFPTSGTNAIISAGQIGGGYLGGTAEYRRYRLLYQRFVSLNDQGTLVLMGRARLGFMETATNSRIPSEERFRIGGLASVHGYSFNEIGGPMGVRSVGLNSESVPDLDEYGNPILDSSGNPTSRLVDKRTVGLTQSELDELRGGGIFERVFNLEFLFPLTGESIRGVVFYDAGNVNAERRQYQLLGEEAPGFFDLLHATGAGVRFITPVGVLRFEYGAKLNPEPGESPDRFDFTISGLF